jgi:hypothetical protein
MPDQPLRPISRIWIRRLETAGLAADSTVVEVAPGVEPKIGTALAMLGFRGTIFLVEPDEKAAHTLYHTYTELLPNANVSLVQKPLQDARVGTDLPTAITTLVANHALDDMVMSSILGHTSCPSDEPYSSLTPDDYSYGTNATVLAWKHAVEHLRPASIVVSQYPVRILSQRGFEARQHSGLEVLDRLKLLFSRYALDLDCRDGNNRGGSAHSWGEDPAWREDPRWWLIARFG